MRLLCSEDLPWLADDPSRVHEAYKKGLTYNQRIKDLLRDAYDAASVIARDLRGLMDEAVERKKIELRRIDDLGGVVVIRHP